jgi:hypothetical protein
VLTNLLTYRMEQLPEKVAEYRRGFAASGRPGGGRVTLMLHTYLDDDLDAADRQARGPLQRYLMESLDLNLRAAALPAGGRPDRKEVPIVVRRAYERYLTRDGLFGSAADARRTVERARAAGVDEIACLIDFGIPRDAVLKGLERLAGLAG